MNSTILIVVVIVVLAALAIVVYQNMQLQEQLSQPAAPSEGGPASGNGEAPQGEAEGEMPPGPPGTGGAETGVFEEEMPPSPPSI